MDDPWIPPEHCMDQPAGYYPATIREGAGNDEQGMDRAWAGHGPGMDRAWAGHGPGMET